MQQPSAQGIASLFRGNPAPLQQRIQQEQQGKPGLPPDLQKLLALNIVTNEKDAVAKQQAMDQLAQMQGPQGQQGQPPTVMQTVQEQARQKMQAQQVQAQQQQEGLRALMEQARSPQIPEGTPQPQAQPQGIDDLPVEFQMAGGGIVAFEEGGKTGKYETPYDRMNRKNRGELTEEERREQEAREALLAQIPTGGDPTVTGGKRASGSELERNILNTLAALPGAGAAKATTLGRQSLAGLAALLGMDRLNAPEERAAPLPAAAAPEAPYSNEGRTGPRPYTPAPAADLKTLDEQQKRRQAPRPAPVVQPAPAPVAQPMAPAPESQAAKLVNSRLNVDPMAERAAEQERRLKEIGAPDTSTHDRMIAELEKRRAQLEGPQDSFGRLMEYLGQVAQTPRGMSSFEAGAAGSANLRKAEKARQLEQFDLSKQALEVSQKKLDTVRAFATEQYNVGKARFDQVYKEQFEAAKEITKDEAEARKLAQENTLKRLEIDSAERRNAASNATSVQVANINAAAREAAGGGGSGGDKQKLAELKALQTSLKDQLKEGRMMGSAGDPLRAQLAQVNRAIAQMAGLDTILGAPGAPQGPGGNRPPLSSFQR
jgi:hypothetical protein